MLCCGFNIISYKTSDIVEILHVETEFVKYIAVFFNFNRTRLILHRLLEIVLMT